MHFYVDWREWCIGHAIIKYSGSWIQNFSGNSRTKRISKISAIRSAALAVILLLSLGAISWKKLFDLNPDRSIITFLWRPTCSPISSQNKPRLTSHDAPNWWHYLIARRETKNDSDEETGLDSEISERHKMGHLYIVKDNSTLNPKPTHTNSICQSL